MLRRELDDNELQPDQPICGNNQQVTLRIYQFFMYLSASRQPRIIRHLRKDFITGGKTQNTQKWDKRQLQGNRLC